MGSRANLVKKTNAINSIAIFVDCFNHCKRGRKRFSYLFFVFNQTVLYLVGKNNW